jgi:hypothetical protein
VGSSDFLFQESYRTSEGAEPGLFAGAMNKLVFVPLGDLRWMRRCLFPHLPDQGKDREPYKNGRNRPGNEDRRGSLEKKERL